jgi:hypothetical protein
MENNKSILNIPSVFSNWILNSFEEFLKDPNGAGPRIKQWIEEEATEEEAKEFIEYYYSYINEVGKFCETFLKDRKPPKSIPYYPPKNN